MVQYRHVVTPHHYLFLPFPLTLNDLEDIHLLQGFSNAIRRTFVPLVIQPSTLAMSICIIHGIRCGLLSLMFHCVCLSVCCLLDTQKWLNKGRCHLECELWGPKEPRIRWGPKHTWACPDLPAVDILSILNVIYKGPQQCGLLLPLLQLLVILLLDHLSMIVSWSSLKHAGHFVSKSKCIVTCV